MDFVAVDVETTGTLSHLDHIVEIAALKFCDGQVVDQFSSLVNPGVPMPKEASHVNGITDEMLKDQPKIETILKPFSFFCSSYCLVAHNAVFDFQFLSAVLEKHQCPAPEGPMLDTYTLSKAILSGLSNYKLSTLAEYFKISPGRFHRATQDAWTCGYLFKALLKLISDRQLTHHFQKPNERGEKQPITIRHISKLCGKKELHFPIRKEFQLSLLD